MHRSRSVGPSEKLYINNALSVTGERIEVVAQASRRVAITKRQHRIELDSTPSATGFPEEEERGRKQATIKLKECVPSGEDVLSRQVRKIRETVQVEELERLLIGLAGGAEERRRAERPSMNLGQIYHRFFGAYYETLRDVVKKSKMSSIT